MWNGHGRWQVCGKKPAAPSGWGISVKQGAIAFATSQHDSGIASARSDIPGFSMNPVIESVLQTSSPAERILLVEEIWDRIGHRTGKRSGIVRTTRGARSPAG